MLAKYSLSSFSIRFFGVVSAVFFLIIKPSVSFASCSFNSGIGETIREINFGTVVVQRDSPVGTVLASKGTGPYAGGAWLFRCTTPWTYRWEMTLFTALNPIGGKVYNTNIDGVGVRVTNEGSSQILNYDQAIPAANWISIGIGMKVELIKTKAGAVGVGMLNTGRLARASIANVMYTAGINLTGSNSIVPVACSVTSTSINVPMGDKIPLTAFTGPGSVAAERIFSIPLSCDANTRVRVTLDGTAHSSGVAGVLALDPFPSETVAGGVGLQLLFNSAPVALKTPIMVGTVVSDGNYSIPLSARYYQTGATVTGGRANSTATFTLTYN
ncbi:fimbrial protein [Pseudomonas protegens]|uniref:fimbrial protein n=1 Tax=Pseudomonas protegens TaxID=380021 RepID=UPI0022825F74|nr:fimbrial protein [Pseudomonas protegens]MCY7261893.1 fimbrial protein [Pseudomonas protegens]